MNEHTKRKIGSLSYAIALDSEMLTGDALDFRLYQDANSYEWLMKTSDRLQRALDELRAIVPDSWK